MENITRSQGFQREGLKPGVTAGFERVELARAHGRGTDKPAPRVSRLTRKRVAPNTVGGRVLRQDPVLMRVCGADRLRHASCSRKGREDAMQVMVEVTTALTGVALGVAAGRLFLEGILNVAFRKSRTS